MSRKLGSCRKEDDYQENRPWWEPPYVIYGISNNRVKSMLEKLMGSYIVRATDHDYMLRLQKRSREIHEDEVHRKIHQRELKEVEREKRLILEGKMPVEKTPEELANHPVFRINEQVKKILEEKYQESRKKHKKIKRFNYDLLEGMEEELVEEVDIYSCMEEDETSSEIMRKIKQLQDELAIEEPFTEEDYLRIKYEDPMVEELQGEELNVDDLYELADEIIGELSGRTCGGMLSKIK